ncbi:MAG: TlpA family protein disulfide reductase [Bdellovibrionales bacterium]|nr:TlpA family protein disulfide reductase [Bdellovibrionales bacterium]
MNKHLRALLIVGGLAVLIVVAVLAYKGQSRMEAEADAEANAQKMVQLKEPLPPFTAKALDGKEIQLSQFKGKVVVVNFWASWCGPCIEEVPSLIKLLKTFPNDLELIAISGDSNQADIDSFMKSFPEMKTLPNIHVVWDADKSLSQKYQIYRLPESFLLNKDLKLIKKISGTIDWHTEDAIAYIKQVISGTEAPAAGPATGAGTSQDEDSGKTPEDQN